MGALYTYTCVFARHYESEIESVSGNVDVFEGDLNCHCGTSASARLPGATNSASPRAWYDTAANFCTVRAAPVKEKQIK